MITVLGFILLFLFDRSFCNFGLLAVKFRAGWLFGCQTCFRTVFKVISKFWRFASSTWKLLPRIGRKCVWLQKSFLCFGRFWFIKKFIIPKEYKNFLSINFCYAVRKKQDNPLLFWKKIDIIEIFWKRYIADCILGEVAKNNGRWNLLWDFGQFLVQKFTLGGNQGSHDRSASQEWPESAPPVSLNIPIGVFVVLQSLLRKFWRNKLRIV